MSGWGQGGLPGNAKNIGIVTVAVGAVGALSVFSAGDKAPDDVPTEVERPTVEADDPVETAQADDVSVRLDSWLCAPRLLKTDRGCAALSELKSAGQGLLAEDALPKRPLTLVHPEDFDAEPRAVDSCATYAELKRQDWSALSNADMRSEARFYRACGLLLLARQAEATPSAATLDRPDLMDLDKSTLPAFGEARIDASAKLTREDESPSVWSITTDGLLFRMMYLGTADFDADGAPEHLVEYRMAAREGSYRDTGFGFIQRSSADRVTFKSVNPFTM